MLELEPKTTLVIAPHPDDEVFGCGGFIRRLKKTGHKVYVLYMTVGTTRDFSSRGESLADERLADMEKVVDFLEIDGYAIALPGDEYHLQLDAAPQKTLVHAIERGDDISLEGLRPELVLTPSDIDYNQDHRAVSRATMTALRPASKRYKGFQPMVMTYELPYHQWNVADAPAGADFYVTLSAEDLGAKVSALELYESQLKAPDSPLSVHGVRTLAAFRGLQCAEAFAEAYKIRRMVI